jgi:hypothetical protein
MRWSSAALAAYAIGVVAWSVAPGARLAEIFLCLPALGWAGAVVALLPLTPSERRPVDRGALVLGVLFLVMVLALPGLGRLVALSPLLGGLTLLWRLRSQVTPRLLPMALTLMAALYAAGLALLLSPADVGDAAPLVGAIGLDLLVVGYLMAVAHAAEAGERLRPDLRRAMLAAAVALLLAGLPAGATMMITSGHDAVALLQFGLLAVAAALAGLGAHVRRLLDRLALRHDAPLRSDRDSLFLNADALLRRRQPRRLGTVGEPEFLRLTRRALNDFGDLNRLARSPLTDLPAVERRLAGREDQPRARARELRAVLRESVSALRPPGPFSTTEEWRYYNVLQFCCILGLNPYVRRPRSDGMSREARLAVDWFRRYVPRDVTRQWQREAAMIVAERLWAEVGGRHRALPAQLPADEITTRSS